MEILWCKLIVHMGIERSTCSAVSEKKNHAGVLETSFVARNVFCRISNSKIVVKCLKNCLGLSWFEHIRLILVCH